MTEDVRGRIPGEHTKKIPLLGNNYQFAGDREGKMSKHQWKTPVVMFLVLGMLVAFSKMDWIKSGASEDKYMKDQMTCEMQSRPTMGVLQGRSEMPGSGIVGRMSSFADCMRGFGYKRMKQKGTSNRIK